MIKKFKELFPEHIRRLLSQSKTALLRQVRKWTTAQRLLPSFIIIGAQKSGTSTLYHYLQQHPEIAMSFDKESKFFDRYYRLGIRWYRHQFPFKWRKKQVGDNTPFYLFHPLVPKRIAELLPGCKFIVLLRNPVHRAYSHFQMEKRKNRALKTTFEEAIIGEQDRIEKAKQVLLSAPLEVHHIYENTSYLSRGIYVDQINNWFQYFDKSQFHIIQSEHFFKNPKETLFGIYQFLEISEQYPRDMIPQNTYQYQRLTVKTLAELNSFYEPYNHALEMLLGTQFSWTTENGSK